MTLNVAFNIMATIFVVDKTRKDQQKPLFKKYKIIFTSA